MRFFFSLPYLFQYDTTTKDPGRNLHISNYIGWIANLSTWTAEKERIRGRRIRWGNRQPPPPPPPLLTSSKASFALGAPLKKVRRSEDDTRSDTPQGRPSVETSDPVLGPKIEAAADDDDDNEVINIFDSINGDVPPQYHNLFWHTNQDIPLLAAFFYPNGENYDTVYNYAWQERKLRF